MQRFLEQKNATPFNSKRNSYACATSPVTGNAAAREFHQRDRMLENAIGEPMIDVELSCKPSALRRLFTLVAVLVSLSIARGQLAQTANHPMDPDLGWYFRTYMDAGEHGVDKLATPLKRGIIVRQTQAILMRSLLTIGGPRTRSNVLAACSSATPVIWRGGIMRALTAGARPEGGER